MIQRSRVPSCAVVSKSLLTIAATVVAWSAMIVTPAGQRAAHAQEVPANGTFFANDNLHFDTGTTTVPGLGLWFGGIAEPSLLAAHGTRSLQLTGATEIWQFSAIPDYWRTIGPPWGPYHSMNVSAYLYATDYRPTVELFAFDFLLSAGDPFPDLQLATGHAVAMTPTGQTVGNFARYESDYLTFDPMTTQMVAVKLSTDPGGPLALVDTVVVNPVPEPAGWAMLLVGLGVVGMITAVGRASIPWPRSSRRRKEAPALTRSTFL